MYPNRRLALTCGLVVLLYLPSIVLDDAVLFSDSWGNFVDHSVNASPALAFYGPWKSCWVFNYSMYCQRNHWPQPQYLTTVVLTVSVVLCKSLFVSCLFMMYKLMNYIKVDSLKIVAVIKLINCVISTILHIAALLILSERMPTSLGSASDEIAFATGFNVIVMLVMVLELRFILKSVAYRDRIDISNLLDLTKREDQGPCSSIEQDALGRESEACSFRPAASRYSTQFSLSNNPNVINPPSSQEAGSHFQNSNEERDNTENVVLAHTYRGGDTSPRILQNRKPVESFVGSSEKESVEEYLFTAIRRTPIPQDDSIQTITSHVLHILGIKLRSQLVRKIEDGHEVLPFKYNVLVSRGCPNEENCKLEEMTPFAFVKVNDTDSELVIFEYKYDN